MEARAEDRPGYRLCLPSLVLEQAGPSYVLLMTVQEV